MFPLCRWTTYVPAFQANNLCSRFVGEQPMFPLCRRTNYVPTLQANKLCSHFAGKQPMFLLCRRTTNVPTGLANNQHSHWAVEQPTFPVGWQTTTFPLGWLTTNVPAGLVNNMRLNYQSLIQSLGTGNFIKICRKCDGAHVYHYFCFFFCFCQYFTEVETASNTIFYFTRFPLTSFIWSMYSMANAFTR